MIATLSYNPYVTLLLYGMTVWRITKMITEEAGPFKMFTHFRRIVAKIEHDDQGLPTFYPDTMIADLLSCVWCSSVWVGMGLLAVQLLLPHYFIPLCLPFFGSTIAIIIDGRISRNY